MVVTTISRHAVSSSTYSPRSTWNPPAGIQLHGPTMYPWLSVPPIAGAVYLLLAMQTFALRPRLNARSDLVLRGDTPPPSSLHLVYIVLEVVKVAALLALGIVAVR